MARARKILYYIWIVIFLSGCSTLAGIHLRSIDSQAMPIASYTPTISPTPFQALTNTPTLIPPTFTPTETFTPTPTATPVPTDTPIPTDSPTHNPVTAPILLYHHVSDSGGGTRYIVSIADFRAQMEALRDWGYTTITMSQLVDAMVNGGELPQKPVAITFDDGNIDIYQNAFPIMHEMGFVATTYIVGDNLKLSRYYVNIDQIKELINDGWEVGSHSISHSDLTYHHPDADYEIVQSRAILEQALGVPVNTFAYPYGRTDDFITNEVMINGYLAGVGLGLNPVHSFDTLFDLDRAEVQGDYSFSRFTSLLPWSGE